MKLFEYNPDKDKWVQLAYDLVGNSKTSASGTSIALVNSGDTLAIGGGPDDASSKGKVVVYEQKETSSQPSSMPSAVPSKEPSKEPSSVPSFQPSSIPSKEPSSVPSSAPSSVPSKEPSSAPSSVPTDVPSSQPSSVPSKKPSSVPSSVPSSPPSFVPSQHPSDIPSVRPSASSEPSSRPSLLGERRFMILSKFKKLTDLPMGDRLDKNWCLERVFSSNSQGGNPLKMRPCDSDEVKQHWYYHKENKVISNTEDDSGENLSGICITRNGRQLVAKQCTALLSGVTTIVSEEALNRSENSDTTGSISIKTDNNEFYFAVDSFRIFSRVKLLKKGTENSSYDKWQFRYHGPSSFPTSVSWHS